MALIRLLILTVSMICLSVARLYSIQSLLINGRVLLMMISYLLVVLILVLQSVHLVCTACLIQNNLKLFDYES